MKINRILTLVGTSSVATLPIIAVASCSSTTLSPLEIEANKFTTSLPASDPKLTTDEAIRKITLPSEQGEKLLALKSLVNNFPMLSSESNFTLTINSVAVDSKVPTSINVSLTVTQASDSATKNATFTITGLTAVTGVQIEAKRFDISLPAITKETTTQQAIRLITEPATEALKIEAINKLVNNFPTPNSGFELIIHTGKVDATTATSINIMIGIKQSDSEATADATFTITGLTAETPKEELLRLAKEKLKDQAVTSAKASETASEAAGKISAQNLNNYYPEVTLAKGVTYEFQSATAVDNSLKVTVKITNTGDQSVVDYTFTITGFTSPLQAQANKFKAPLAAKVSSTTTRQAARDINDVDAQDQKLAAINKLVDNFPTTGNEFLLSIGEAIVNVETPTLVNIDLTISNKVASKTGETSVKVTFTITSLTEESVQQELQRLAREKLTSKFASRGAGLVTSASEAKTAITNNPTLDMYYPRVNLGKGIRYTYASSSIDSHDNKILDVTVGVISGGVAIGHEIKIIFPNATPPTISK